ncbi:HAD-IA family hydrolase [Synechococcales cyanobacterium C]|uniref:HAD-IA family hydrolase n=1 Tax=Petrachloros mirabilis ULC683 TaxID=2781853 RepID=A0A8K1ZZB8_9CYAN|nr:HAD family phosphatase [Petrachloros mirabilis]NCJ06602.1 HAD-IA family hydrolase [Petrachloros mirabilis ULC683]
MTLKAILFDFNGVLIDDEPLHQELLVELLLQENLSTTTAELKSICLGRSDRACLQDLLTRRGRLVEPEYLESLMRQKSTAYQKRLAALPQLPLFTDVCTLIQTLRTPIEGRSPMKLAIVSGARQTEITWVLTQAQLRDSFDILVSADDIQHSKPDPEAYTLAIDRFNQTFPDLQLTPGNCLAIEDSRAGIEAAKRAQVPVVGVAHTYPFHMMQRWANWAVDYLDDLELERIYSMFEPTESTRPQNTNSNLPI